jgi:hypothetical protein
MMRRPEQVPTERTTLAAIMRSRAFHRGVAEVRAGHPPNYECDSWEYEYGRLWAITAPKNMPVMIGRRINPAAIDVYIRSDIP